MPKTLAHPSDIPPSTDTPSLDAITARLAGMDPQLALPVAAIYRAGQEDAAAAWSRISGLSLAQLLQVLDLRAEMALEAAQP